MYIVSSQVILLKLDALGYISVTERIRAVTHGWSATKRKLWKSAFSEGLRHFERQFQVDGDVARNRSMDLWIGEWCSYNFAAGRFHTKKCSRLFSREVGFYWHKQRYRVFVPPFEGLTGNVHGSATARWKARGRLPISANLTFFASYHGWGAMSWYWSKFRCLKGVGHFERKFQGERGLLTIDFWYQKSRVPGLSYGGKNRRKVQSPE